MTYPFRGSGTGVFILYKVPVRGEGETIMDKKKVIVVERISDKGVEMLKAQPDLEVDVKFAISPGAAEDRRGL